MSADTPSPEVPVDESQARLLERLRAAAGDPVSFEELRSLGIENPAVLAYELDLVGMPIERVHRYDAPGRAVPVGVRIEEPDATPAMLVHSPRPRYPPRPQVARGRWRRRAYEAREFARARLSAAAVRTLDGGVRAPGTRAGRASGSSGQGSTPA